ncbi:MAG: hypothetical protein KGI64_06660, partial [Xanthomonadaceae bacterium]|nr:hypothetical protein [Xanthomonadaceae bacterium]
ENQLKRLTQPAGKPRATAAPRRTQKNVRNPRGARHNELATIISECIISHDMDKVANSLFLRGKISS